jgi:hypothetical protein
MWGCMLDATWYAETSDPYAIERTHEKFRTTMYITDCASASHGAHL